jgi:hypothetical protein
MDAGPAGNFALTTKMIINLVAKQMRLHRASLILVLSGLFTLPFTSRAAIPSPEKLLPDDTLLMLTAPDYSKLSAVIHNSPQGQLWNDPALKPFKEKFLSKWNEQVIKPLERDLDVKLDNYCNLLQGQITFAITQNGWQGQDDQEPAILLLLDSKDKSDQLKKTIADLRKKCVDAGKAVRTEKIRDSEFMILPVSTNDVPKSLRKLFTPSAPAEDAAAEKDAKKPSSKDELVIGQVESLLVVGSMLKPVEKVVSHIGAGGVPTLGEQAAYQANHQSMFRDSPLYGWLNTKAVLDIVNRLLAQKKESADTQSQFDFDPAKALGALGFTGLKTIAFSIQDSTDGAVVQLLLGVPESGREGLFKILAGEPKEATPPPFVPADVVKFQRYRIDGQKAWATLQKMLGDISPQVVSVLNFMLDTANTAAKDKDPSFDIRKNLIGNLGDDFITYEKAPKGKSLAEMQSPSLFLLGSPKAEELAGAFKSALVYLAQQSDAKPEEREFLGRKIYSIPVRSMGLPFGGASPASGKAVLSYAASKGYVAMSTDSAILEEYLRSSESQGKTLRETAGIADATQKVSGSGTSLFGYENDSETVRTLLDALRKDAGSSASILGGLGIPGAGDALKDWFDFSLLPSFDKISKYFSFSVYGMSAGADGLRFKVFSPTPPQMKNGGQ